MTPDNYLFFFVVGVFAVTALILLTDKTTPEERDEMLKDEDMWP